MELKAEPIAHQRLSTGVDLEDGRVINARPTRAQQPIVHLSIEGGDVSGLIELAELVAITEGLVDARELTLRPRLGSDE
jgi:hypothetical protein